MGKKRIIGSQGSNGAIVSRKDVSDYFVSEVSFQTPATSLPLAAALVAAFLDLGFKTH